MASEIVFYQHEGSLKDAQGRKFDTLRLRWSKPMELPEGLTPISPEKAVQWVQKKSGAPIRPPLAVLGPREVKQPLKRIAWQVGFDLAELGVTIICSGRQGVMEAVCRGVHEGGGISIGLLPEEDWSSANPYVTIPIATGMGIAKNALITRAAFVVLAIGGGLGTLSKIALSLQFGKPVFTLCGAPVVEGAQSFKSWETLRPILCAAYLGVTPS